MNSTDSAAVLNSEPRVDEQREQKDRRRHDWKTVTYCGLRGRGRRRSARRDGQSYYLDRYEPGLVFTGLGIILLSCLDALLTMTLLNRGAHEANQFMAHLLEVGIGTFVTAKIAITCTGILFLLMHSHFQLLNVINGKQILKLLLFVYGALILYELVLLGIIK